MITGTLLKLRLRRWQRQLPKVITMRDFDPQGVRFEATNITELHRIVSRGWEADYLGRMVAALEPDDVLYDVGANIGLVALNAASRCRVVAFEPDPGFLGRLQRNLDLNLSATVDVLPIAISDTDAVVTLFTDGVDGTSPSLVHQRGESCAVQVQAHKLDTLLATAALPRPTVLKLDIEGAEILALRGASCLLGGETAPRLLFLEVHDSFLPGFGSSADEVLTLVRQAGYRSVLYQEKRSDQQHLILSRR